MHVVISLATAPVNILTLIGFTSDSYSNNQDILLVLGYDYIYNIIVVSNSVVRYWSDFANLVQLSYYNLYPLINYELSTIVVH